MGQPNWWDLGVCCVTCANPFVLQSSRKFARSGSNARRMRRPHESLKMTVAEAKCLLMVKKVLRPTRVVAPSNFHLLDINLGLLKFLANTPKVLLQLAFNNFKGTKETTTISNTLATPHRPTVHQTCTVSIITPSVITPCSRLANIQQIMQPLNPNMSNRLPTLAEERRCLFETLD